MRRPSGIIFDYGDTVLHTDRFGGREGSARLLEFAVDNHGLTGDDVQRAADELAAEIQPLKDTSMLEVGVPAFYRVLFGRLGLTFSISYEQMEREFWRAAVNYVPCPGIGRVLDTLEAHGIRAGIISNSSFSGTVMAEALREFSLAHRFEFLMSSADYGFRKPHPRIYEIAVKKLGLQAEDVWFVGDKQEYDVKGALASGLSAVWYNARNARSDGQYKCLEVRDWEGFCGCVEEACRV